MLPFWVSVLPTGGDDGVRTHDPLLAGQVLSQLSYTPMFPGSLFQRSFPDLRKLNNKSSILRFLCQTPLVIRRLR